MSYLSLGLALIGIMPSLASNCQARYRVLARAAFSGNKLSYLEVPGSLSSIADEAFFGNELIEVDIGEGVTTIKYGCFPKKTPYKNYRFRPLSSGYIGMLFMTIILPSYLGLMEGLRMHGLTNMYSKKIHS